MEAESLKFKTQNHNSELKTNLRARTYGFSLSMIKFISSLTNDRTRQIISNQLLRSATSIGANIIEAKSSSSKKDFIKFYDIALKSANETEYWLGLLMDGHLAPINGVQPLLDELTHISRMLGSSLLTLKGKRKS